MMLDGNATAGHYFAKYVGLEGENSGVIIEIIRFTDLENYDSKLPVKLTDGNESIKE